MNKNLGRATTTLYLEGLRELHPSKKGSKVHERFKTTCFSEKTTNLDDSIPDIPVYKHIYVTYNQ